MNDTKTERSRTTYNFQMASTDRMYKFEIQFQKAKCLILQHPRAVMQWIGEVEEVKSIDDLISSASQTGKSILDFENLNFKIASGLRKILTGNFNQQVTTAEGTVQSEKRSLTGRQIAWMIYEFCKISGDNEAILDSRIIGSSSREQQRSIFRRKVARSVISSHWQTFWQHMGESVHDANCKVRRVEIMCCTSTLKRRHSVDYCTLKVIAPTHLDQKLQWERANGKAK